jgi:hypothetical protein
MDLHGRSILCAAALFMMASISARAAPDWIAPDQRVEIPPVTAETRDAAPSSAGVPLTVFVPYLTPGFEFSAGLLLIKPSADNLGYATITTFLPVGSPQWAVQTLDPKYQPGFTVGAQYAFPCSGNDIQVNWESLRTSDSAFVAVSDPTTQWVSPFNQTGPSTSEPANFVGVFHLKATQAQVDFDYDMVNIDMGQAVNIGSNTELRLFAGLTCVRLREQLISTFYNNPNIDPVPPVFAIPNPSLRSISLNNTSTYTGLGPRFGLADTYNLSHGFTCVGQLSGAILGGWTEPAQYSFTALFQDTVNSEQISSPSASQVVYACDAKLGLGYSRPLGNGSVLTIESAFKAVVFINPFSTYETSTNVLPLDIGSLSTNSMRYSQSNFTLSGLYTTCSLQW